MTLIWFLIISLKLALTFGQTVTIPDGTLQGTTNQTEVGNVTFYAFRGIPYAQPPINLLRFASPVKNDAWNGTLDATQDKSVCTQKSSTATDGIGGSEDCLFINVYTTNLTGSLPVMVFIHGGGFTLESSSYAAYAPDPLLDKGVLYVAMNYRLGIFGFLSTEDTVAPGNWGFKDQVLALKWVQDNIAYFGGDPTKVTLFGQSAGAASISYLLQSNLTTGLYRGAIMNSGQSLCLWALSRNSSINAFLIGDKLGVVALTSQALVDGLRAVTYKDLKIAEANITTAVYLANGFLAGFPIGPVTEPEHTGAIFTGASYDTLLAGDFQKVPVIIGYDSNELGAIESAVDSIKAILSLYDVLPARVAPYDLRATDAFKITAGTSIKNHYFGTLGLVETSATTDFLRFASVDQFVRPIRESVLLMSASTSVYYYEFLYKGVINLTNQTYNEIHHLQVGSSSSLGVLTWVPNTSSDTPATSIKYLAINNTIAMATNPDQTDWTFYKSIYSTYGVSSYYDTY